MIYPDAFGPLPGICTAFMRYIAPTLFGEWAFIAEGRQGRFPKLQDAGGLSNTDRRELVTCQRRRVWQAGALLQLVTWSRTKRW